MTITQRGVGSTADGREVRLFELTGPAGLKAEIISHGGSLTSLTAPDRDGRPADVTLGYVSMGDYAANPAFFGCLVGRYANRIAGGVFELGGVTRRLARNSHGHHLHGGVTGFHSRFWEASPEDGPEPRLHLRYVSPDGEEGYPGRLEADVTYTLTTDRGLEIAYRAVTDRETIVNLTNHAYFNLAGPGASDCLGHHVAIMADRYLPVNDALIPTGEIRSVEGGPMDLRGPVRIGDRIDSREPQMVAAGGYDFNWVLRQTSDSPTLAARVLEPGSGRVMEVWTTQPGVQFYTGNQLTGDIMGKGGAPYGKWAGFCLETQGFPDAVHHPHFPSVVLKPGEIYAHRTLYRFTTDAEAAEA